MAMSGYPLVDRSGVEANPAQLPGRGPAPVVGGAVDVEVCQDSTCYNNGAEVRGPDPRSAAAPANHANAGAMHDAADCIDLLPS